MPFKINQNNPRSYEKLQPGDIVLKYEKQNPDIKGRIIQLGQKIRKNEQPESHFYIHAGIYLGSGRIAEATSSDLGDLIESYIHGPRFTFEEKSGELRIFRILDPKMAKEMAKIASSIVKFPFTVGEQKETGRYDLKKAIFSTLLNPGSPTKRLKQLLKAGFYATAGGDPIKGKKHKDFFCSYLVAWAMQGADAKRAIEAYNHSHDEKITLPNLRHIPVEDRHAKVKQWADEIIIKHGSELESLVAIDLDAKTCSPARLVDFMMKNRGLFEYIGRIYS